MAGGLEGNRGGVPSAGAPDFPREPSRAGVGRGVEGPARPGKTVEVVCCLARRRKGPAAAVPWTAGAVAPPAARFRLPGFCFLVFLPPCQLASWQPGRAAGELAGWMDSRAHPGRSRLASWQRVMAREEARGGWATDPVPRGASWDPRAPARARGRRRRPEGLWKAGSPGHPCQGGRHGHGRDSTRGRGHRCHTS